MKLFIANWKMHFTTQQALTFCQNNLETFKTLKNKLIICPSLPALTVLSQILKDTDVALGAQTVSEHTSGSFTGQVAAQDLVQSGCSYVLIGHSEERIATCVSDETITQKTLRVLEAGMIPVVCIGENKEVYDAGNTQEYLEEQLYLLKRALNGAPIYIAYEPLWAIGTGKTPTKNELIDIFSKLKLFMQGSAFLYGGSVNEKSINELNSIEQICGFLIGGASLKFENLQKILF